MPITSKSFVRSTALMLLVGLLALLGIVGTNVWLVERSQGYFDEVIEARIIRRSVIDLRAMVQDIETSQRGYIITLDDAYLEPYELALPQVRGELERLKTLLAPYPTTAPQLAQLEQDIDFKLTEMAETIELARQGRVEEAVAQVRTDRGKAAMDGARAFFAQFLQAIDDQLSEGVRNQTATTDALRWVSLGGGIIILIVVCGAIWTVLRYTQELGAARREVEAANASLEDRVRERTSDLGKANEEIQRFAYIVTHDLRAPLVNVMGFTSELETSVAALRTYMDGKPYEDNPAFVEAKQAATEDLPEAIGFIRAATRKMDGLINAILKISREGRRQLKPEQLDLEEIVTASAAAIHHQIAEKQGKVSTDIRASKLVGDKLSLEQILGNLLDNAIKYQHPERPLHLDIRSRHVPGNRITIEVADNGRGIAAGDHERVFELFRRSGAQSQPGEGIGLAHVRTMARSLGGDISLTSQLGAGTTFTINLPRDVRTYLGNSDQ
ncbi:MAG: CHASE3 domain-containing protein [Devosia sp.]|nr:CHASE3 domain-containing protein [Devosia sp.]